MNRSRSERDAMRCTSAYVPRDTNKDDDRNNADNHHEYKVENSVSEPKWEGSDTVRVV